MKQNEKKDYYDDNISTKEMYEILGISNDDETYTTHTGNGYAGNSMSNNAVDAYAKDRKPISKWRKNDIINKIDANREIIKCNYDLLTKQPLEVLRELLLFSNGEYHHTGLRYNETTFYSFNTERLSNLTDERIKQTAAEIKFQKQKERESKLQKKVDDEQYNGRWEAVFTKQSADGKYKRDITLIGEVKNGWFYPDPDSELDNKRNIHSKCFRLVKRL